MTKSNPLFVDSTRFHGDLIATHIELKNVILRDGENLYVNVTNHQGVLRRLVMKPLDERSFEAKLHLNHQTLTTYQFVIEKDGLPLYFSAALKTRAQYALIETWEPVLDDSVGAPAIEIVQEEEAAPAPATPAKRSDSNWARESSMNVATLIEKWGL
jgi:hypothetical protein